MKGLSGIFIIAAGSLWGTMGIFVKAFSGLGLGSMEIVAVRVCITAVMMLAFLLIYNRNLLRIKPRDLWCFFGTGILSIVFFNYCYFKAIMLSTLAVAATLLYTAPMFVIIMSAIVYKEKITVSKAVSILLSLAGCSLVAGLNKAFGSASLFSILAGLCAGFGYALYSIFGRAAIEREYDSLTITAYTFIFASAGILPFSDFKAIFAAFQGKPMLPLFCFIFCLITTILPYLLYTIGLNHIKPWKAAVLASVEPVVAAVIGIVFFHEAVALNVIIGMLLVIGAIIVSAAPKSKKASSYF